MIIFAGEGAGLCDRDAVQHQRTSTALLDLIVLLVILAHSVVVIVQCNVLTSIHP